MTSSSDSTIDLIQVLIPALSLNELGKRYAQHLGMGVFAYRDCGFARESDAKAQYYVYLGLTPPVENTLWRQATAREAVWLNITSYEREDAALFDGDLRTSSVIVPVCNHLNNPNVCVIIEQREGVMGFRSSYERDIPPHTPALWLRRS